MNITGTANTDSVSDSSQRTGTVSVTKWAGKAFFIIRRWPIIPAGVLALMVICAIFAPWIAPQGPYENELRDRLVPPVWTSEGQGRYLLGTDHIGRDILSRIIHGARVSAVVISIATSVGVTVGTILGIIAGYFGRHIDEVIMRIVDTWAALPFIMVALVVVQVMGQSYAVLVGLLALLSWPGAVRLVRAEVLSLRSRDYVDMARVAGGSAPRIMYKHILPSVWNVVLVTATLSMGGIILTEATLSFLGVGIPPPTPAWGTMTSDGRGYLNDAWWVSMFPGVCIFLVVMAGNFMGDWLRDRLDPTIRQIN